MRVDVDVSVCVCVCVQYTDSLGFVIAKMDNTARIRKGIKREPIRLCACV